MPKLLGTTWDELIGGDGGGDDSGDGGGIHGDGGGRTGVYWAAGAGGDGCLVE